MTHTVDEAIHRQIERIAHERDDLLAALEALTTFLGEALIDGTLLRANHAVQAECDTALTQARAAIAQAKTGA